MSVKPNAPMPIESSAELAGGEFEPLLSEPFARVWEQPSSALADVGRMRDRLLGRLAASRAAESMMFTVRRNAQVRRELADGVFVQDLYVSQAASRGADRPGSQSAAPAGDSILAKRELRPGEPFRARLIEMAAGSKLLMNALADETQLETRHREWLVLGGSVRLGDELLALRDYHLTPAGCPTPSLVSADGALLFLRESDHPADPDDRPQTIRDGDAGWPEYAPGIARRVLWQRNGQAAMLYFAQPGAQVPNHAHGHDEECLMVQGELFLDDLLLRVGDYQLAPAGTGHRITETDTGVVIYAHGDLDLKFIA